MGARDRLRALARRAGYSPGALDLLAQATLPAYVPGARLDNRGVAAVSAAVEACAQAGMSDAHVALLVGHYRARFGEQWQQHFWTGRLRAAALRFNHPACYGPSPCDIPVPLAAAPQLEPALAIARGLQPSDAAVLAADIHPAVAAAPVLRGRAAA
jgi:hypothetical protein